MAYRKDEKYLDPLEEKLYRRGAEFSYEEQKLRKKKYDVKSKWKSKRHSKSRKRGLYIESSILLKLFFVSLVFFVFAVGIAGYKLIFGGPGWSSDNIEVVVEAPSAVEGGDEFAFRVIVTNNERVVIESADLEIIYPEGAVAINTPEVTNNIYRKNLGAILPGESITESMPVILYGEENTEKEFNIKLEYRVEGSSATFPKSKKYNVVLSTAPVSLSVDIPAEINVGEEIKINIKTTSNSSAVLEDFMVVIEYPFGFKFEGADPRPSRGDNIWIIGDIPPSSENEINIRGKMEGVLDEQKTFKIFTGVQNKDDPWEIETVYNSRIRTVPIKASALAINFAINGDAVSPEVVVGSGKSVGGVISWTNNLSDSILNGEIKVKISGAIFDKERVSVNKGDFNSLDNTITWNQISDRTLRVIEPGDYGSARFSLIPYSITSGFENPEMTFELSFTGERVSPGFPNKKITFTDSKKVKITSILEFASYGRYFEGPFVNSGPMPPKVDNETTYTITWSIKNSSNEISDVVVNASVPLYISWKDNISPASEDITYNELSGEIVWNAGSIAAGGASKNVSFQIGFLPSANQIGYSPTLLSQAELVGKDTFTDATIELTSPSVNIKIPRDSQYNNTIHGAVVR